MKTKIFKRTVSLFATLAIMTTMFSLGITASAASGVSISYAFSGLNAASAGYAEGTITLKSSSAGTYSLYWADDTKALDGYYSIATLTLSAGEMPLNGTVKASVTVTNTGSRAGDEIVQLYIHDVYATSTRPVKELKGFKKIHIEAGQSVQVDFTLTKEELSYYNHDLEWVCEPGDFEIMIGPNSRDTQGAMLAVKAADAS